ncbi:MAG: lytic transglycosylase domain-containing protein [Clostridia bacterium]|nr:lytic transglycosylase domain-containing protein [Clostridia bacterium]
MKKKTKIIALLVSLSLAVAAFAFGAVSVLKALYPLGYADFVEAYAEKYNVEKSFIFAVIKCESGFDEKAVSYVGAKGLMQIMPETFQWLKTKTKEELPEEMLFDGETSIKYGCFMYSMLLEKYENKETAVAAYHAGTTNVSKWLKDERFSKDGKTLSEIPFESTKNYVSKVILTEKIYKKLYKSLNNGG